jgi:hypothetical protein
MKLRPGVKLVLGPEIAVVISSCNKIHRKRLPKRIHRVMNSYPEVEALLLGVL